MEEERNRFNVVRTPNNQGDYISTTYGNSLHTIIIYAQGWSKSDELYEDYLAHEQHRQEEIVKQLNYFLDKLHGVA